MSNHGNAPSEQFPGIERYDPTTVWLHWVTIAPVMILWRIGWPLTGGPENRSETASSPLTSSSES